MKRILIIIAVMAFIISGCDDNSSNTNNTNNTNNSNNTNNTNNSNNTNNTNNTNNCSPDSCASAGLHNTVCSLDATNNSGFRCDCEEGFVKNDNGACVLEIADSCSGGLSCLAGYCVAGEGDGQCLNDDECHENLSADAGNPTLCNSEVAGGICMGCRESFPEDCPTGTVCTIYGSCATPCDDDVDCPFGECKTDLGICGQILCSSDEECPASTVCVDDDNNGSGMCLRVPCVETECSVYNPEGECPAGSSCISGSCHDSCDPNPCTEINRTVCQIGADGPKCSCDANYSEDNEGNCIPDQCPQGFNCTNGYCVDPTELFQCTIDSDCGGTLTCSPDLPTGTCNGCTSETQCPTGFDTCLAGYCLKTCNGNGDCADGMECKGSGYCGFKSCTLEADCQPGYTCNGTTSKCVRITCN